MTRPRLDLRFRLPGPERANPLWWAASAAVHAVLVVVVVSAAGVAVRERVTVIRLAEPGAPGPREYPMPALGRGARGAAGAARAAGARPGAPADTAAPLPTEAIIVAEGPAGGDTTAVAGGPVGTHRRIGPAYGDGRLWVRPGEAALGVVGPSADRATHVARVDSAVRARIQAFIDTMPRDSFALPPPADWTTEIDGRTWGIDETWIYLGDLKLPTALLALIPMPQGNYYQAKDAAELQRIREDIIQAARRAETAAQFRRYVDELRRRKDGERAREQARRDTIIP